MLGILSYKAWLIEPAFAAKMAPIVLRSIERGSYDAFIKVNRDANDKVISSLYGGTDAEMVYGRDGLPPYYIAKAKGGEKVAIIPMLGAITKNGDACSYGMRDYQSVMAKVAADPTITAVVYHFNNAPGGSHDGTPEISHNIFNSTKPTLSFIDGMAASAHYYMASQTDHIMMNSLTDSEVGSIGSMVVSENIQNMVAAGNYPKIEIIRAPQSINKALFNHIEPLSQDVRDELNTELRDIVNTFISSVKKGREKMSSLSNTDEAFTGKMYHTKEAIAKGLADSKGSLQDAINMADKIAKGGLSKRTSSPSRAQVIKTMSFKSLLLSDIFGQSEKADQEQPTAEAHQASMLAADTKAAEMEAENATLKAAATNQATKIAELEATVTGLNGQVTSLAAEKATLTEANATLATEKAALQTKLDAKPTGQATTIITDEGKEAKVNADGSTSATEKGKYHSAADDEAEKYVQASSQKLPK